MYVYIYYILHRERGNALPPSLCIKFLQMNAYVKYFNKNSKYMNLLVNDKEILEKYNEIWNKIKNLFQKDFDNGPVYNDKYIKAEVN